MRRVLYLTYDGILDPLGTSQVLRPVVELASRGIPYAIVSLEKSARLAEAGRLRDTRTRLRRAGVPWHHAEYATTGHQRGALNATNVLRLARRALAEGDVGLLHARSHPPTALAWILSRTAGVPYLFDFRGYWLEERQSSRGLLSRSGPFRAAKLLERRLVADASAAVTLTDLAAGDFREGVLGSWPSDRPVETITTVADFDEFRLDGSDDVVPADFREALSDKLVVAYCGSINPFYEVDASLELVRLLAERREDVHFLGLTLQREALSAAADEAGIPASSRTIVSVDQHEVAAWLRLADWGLLLLTEPFAKRGSMPTKLGEFFGAGVRPIQLGCNREVRDWVSRTGSGLALVGKDAASLQAAADHIAAHSLDRGSLEQARREAASHFSLEAGVARYEALLRRLLGSPDAFSPGSSSVHTGSGPPRASRSTTAAKKGTSGTR